MGKNSRDSESSDNSSTKTSQASGGPYAIQFPADNVVWKEARNLVASSSTRVDDLATICSQDPAVVIELIRTSNAMFFSGGKSSITSTKAAIVRLGSDVLIELFDKLSDREFFSDEDVSHWFEVQRGRCRQTAIVARVLSEALARSLSDDCQTSALLINVGEMLAVAHLQSDYIELAEEHSRSGVNYRLAQNFKFDVEGMGLNYLRRNGIPETVLFPIDRDARPQSQSSDRAILKPICMAAAEMVDAFDANRWEKLAPGRNLPPKSSVRMLQMTDSQYLRVYERASEYLFTARLQEEKRRKNAAAQTVSENIVEDDAFLDPDDDFESEINSLLTTTIPSIEEPVEDAVEQQKTEPAASDTTSAPLSDPKDSFSLRAAAERIKAKPRARKKVSPPKPRPKMHSKRGASIVSKISAGMDEADNSEELLTNILAKLVDSGPFEKTALIVVSKDRGHAIVVAARGPNIGNGQRLLLDDPLNPIAQCFSKVQSFGNRSSKISPFGSKAFALAPIDADHETSVALYADCGNEGGITFEARRVFRNVVEILNDKLPEIPGGIPVEL